MADLSSVTDNYLPTASETFADNLSGSISAGATTVPVNSAVEYPDGATVVLTVDPGTALEATFVGKKDTGADQFIECIWTEGNTAVGHDAGATIIDYDSATHYNLLSEAMQLIMNQDGTLKDDPIRTALGLSDASNDGWEVFPYTLSVSSGYSKGQNCYELTVANQDVRTILSKGMKLRLERSTTAPTQCTDLERSSSQYASDSSTSGLGQTDDITVESWVKPESYGNVMGIMSTGNGTTSGWNFYLDANLRPVFGGARAADDYITGHPSVRENMWSHVACTIDSSGAVGTVYINGILVASTFTNQANSAFLANTAFLLGATNTAAPTNFFDGKLSDCRVWSALRTATEIRDNKDQTLVGNETNLVGYWKLNGNFNDSTANANNLTGSGAAVATNTDHPFSDTQYAVVTDVTYSAPNSTVVVYTGNKHLIPNMTLNSPYYSVQKSPYGFPVGGYNWDIEIYFYARYQGSGTANTWQNLGNDYVIPRGVWEYGFSGHFITTHAGTTFLGHQVSISTANNTEGDKRISSRSVVINTSLTEQDTQLSKTASLEVTADTRYYLNIAASASSTQVYIGDSGTLYEATQLIAKFEYV